MAPDTTVTLPASALPRVLTGGIDAVMRDVRIAGDAEFAQVVSTLAKTLRWDAEEDLSKVIGDAASHRVVAAVRSAHGEIRRTGERATAGITEYLLEENPQLVRPRAVVEVDGRGAHVARRPRAAREARRSPGAGDGRGPLKAIVVRAQGRSVGPCVPRDASPTRSPRP